MATTTRKDVMLGQRERVAYTWLVLAAYTRLILAGLELKSTHKQYDQQYDYYMKLQNRQI